MAGIRARIRAGMDQRDLNRVEMQFNKVMGRMAGKEIAFNVNGKSFTQPLGRITSQANEFTKSLEASNARVIAFGASVGIINAVSDAFKGLVAETVKFEKTLADINVIMNSSNAGLAKFGENLFNVAKNTAQSFGVVATAALEFSRQGLSMEETLKRTNDALILTRLTSLKAEEAVAGLTAAVNAFATTGLTTTNIIDKLAAVDVRFAVSSEDLIHALERTGAVAIDAGVELNDLIGLVTALQQTTARGGAVIGNGLKTIFTRIQRPRSIRQIEELGIGVKNLQGAILPADKILLNMAKSFDSLTQAQQSNVVQFSAGIFQANVFRAALRDLAKDQGIYTQASEAAGNAAGEAALKNERLNKTLAALASQSSTAVRELAGVMGELMIKPELGGFMEAFLGSVEGLKNALGGGEDEGNTFAKGFVRGIGNVLTGPGLLAFGAVFIKMLMNVGKFATQSVKDVLGIVDKKEKIRQMEESIVNVLSQNKSIQEGLNELEGDRASQEKFILKIIEAQTNAMVKQKQIAGALAGPLLKAGISTDLTVDSSDFVDLDKNAKIDSFGAKGVIPRSTVQREKQGAAQAGYQPGPIDAMEVKGMGRVVYNKAETVKQFPGMQQPAIMPPQSSRAGHLYKKGFSKQHGFNPYDELNAEKYSGFIPNYADVTLKNNVTQNQERMHLRGTPFQDLPRYVTDQIKQPGGGLGGGNIKFKTPSSNLKSSTFHNIGDYLEALGVNNIETVIPFDFIDLPVNKKGRMTPTTRAGLTQGTTKQRGNFAEAKFLESDAGNGYLSTALDDQGVVDAVSKEKAPTEIKAGSISLQNIFEKSIRRYSNQKFRQTLESVAGYHRDPTRYGNPNSNIAGFSTNGEIADALSESILKLEEDSIVKNLSTLARMGEYTIPGMTKEQLKSSIQGQNFRKDLMASGIGQNERDKLLEFGMSGGLVPNFAGRPSVVDYVGLTKKISEYSTQGERFGNFADLHQKLAADGVSVGGSEIILSALKKPTSTNTAAFKNAWKNVKAGTQDSNILGWNFHTGFGSKKWTNLEIDEMLSDTITRMDSLINPGNVKYAHQLGVDFEKQFRKEAGLGQSPVSRPHMDFPAGSLGNARKNAPDIGLSGRTDSGGDAYRGQKGHDEEHFIAKYLREKFSPGGKFNITNETSQYDQIRHIAKNGGTAKLNNIGRFNDIIGVKDGASRKDRTINDSFSLTSILRKATSLSDHLREKGAFPVGRQGASREVTAPHVGAKVQFKYLQDYVDDLGVVSKGLIPNFGAFGDGPYPSDSKLGSIDLFRPMHTSRLDPWKRMPAGFGYDGISPTSPIDRSRLDELSAVIGSRLFTYNGKSLYGPTGSNVNKMFTSEGGVVGHMASAIRGEVLGSKIDSCLLNNAKPKSGYVKTRLSRNMFDQMGGRIDGQLATVKEGSMIPGHSDYVSRALPEWTTVNGADRSALNMKALMQNWNLFCDLTEGAGFSEAQKDQAATNVLTPGGGGFSNLPHGGGAGGKRINLGARGLIPNFSKIFHGTTMEGARGIIESGGVREGSPEPLSNRGLLDSLISRQGGVYWSPDPSIPGLRTPEALFSTDVPGSTPVHNGETFTDAAGDLKINYETGYNLPLGSQNKEDFKYWEDNYKSLVGRVDDPDSWRHFGLPEVRMAQSFVKDPLLVRPSQGEVMAKKGKVWKHSNVGIGTANPTVPNFARTFYDFDETLGTYPSSVKSAELFQAESALKALPTPLAKSLSGQMIDVMTARASQSSPYIRQKLGDWGIGANQIYTTADLFNNLKTSSDGSGKTKKGLTGRVKGYRNLRPSEKKARLMEQIWKRTGEQMTLVDDSAENIAAIKALKNKDLMGQLYSFSGQSAGRGSGNAKGLIPNFGNIDLYRGTRPGLGKAIPDRPNAPQFLFEKMMQAKTKKEFIDAIVSLGIQHSQGSYSMSYNDQVKSATLEQIRGTEALPEGKVHHGGYIYNRPTRDDYERNLMGMGEQHSSGFVSRSTDPHVADRFAESLGTDESGKIIVPGYKGDVEKRSVNEARIFDQAKIEKYIDRFGLERVQRFFKEGMRNNSLKDIYLNLHKFRTKVESTNPLDMFSPNAGESERSIGMSGGGLTHDEMEITQIWGKHSPYYGEAKGLVPNFLSWRDRPGGGSKIPVPDNPGLFSKEEVDEIKGKGYKRTDHHGWHFAKPIGLKHTPPTASSPFGLAGPVSFDFLSRMIQHDREMYSIPNRDGDNANLDDLGQSLIKGQKDSAIIGYDSTVNRMQLIEGNHRVAALGRLNRDRDKTQKFYTGMHAYVSGVKLRDRSQMDHAAGFVNQQIFPPKIPDDIIKASKDPYRAPGQYVQGSWSPSDFGIPNYVDLEKVKQLAIRGVGGEQKNAKAILGKRTIKSKGIWDKGMLQDFLANPNAQYLGGSLLDYLAGKGYDKDLLLRASRDPGGYQIAGKGLIPNFSAADRVRRSQKQRVKGDGVHVSGGAITEIERAKAEGMYDYMLGEIGGLSPTFGFDPVTMALRGSSSDYSTILRHSKSTKHRAALQNIAGGEEALKKILYSYMLGHHERMLLVRDKYEEPKDELMHGAMFKGMVPNFGNPLMDAIGREKAAGVPGHRIRIEKSSQLKSSRNPAGLAITNTRDEPGGVAQGIRRARTMSMNPKTHGTAKGFTPNFAEVAPGTRDSLPTASTVGASGDASQIPDMSGIKDFVSTSEEAAEKIEIFADLMGDVDGIEELKAANEAYTEAVNAAAKKYGNQEPDKKDKSLLQSADVKQADAARESAVSKVMHSSMDSGQEEAFDKAQDALIKHSDEIGKNSAEVNKNNKEQEHSLQRLFFMQSAISMLNGQLQEFAETGGKATRHLAEFGMGLSNVAASFIQAQEIGGQIKEMTGTNDGTGLSLNPETWSGDGAEKRKKKTRKVEKQARSKAGKSPGMMGKVLSHFGKAGRIFGRFVPILGQLYTGFTIVNEVVKLFSGGKGIMDHMKSASEKAAEKIENLGKVAEGVNAALEAMEAKTKNAAKLADLEAKGDERTVAQEKEYYDLRLKAVDADQKVTQTLTDLGNEAKVGELGLDMLDAAMEKAGIATFDGSEKAKKALQELAIATKQATLMQITNKGFMDNVEASTDRLSGQDERNRIMALAESYAVSSAHGAQSMFYEPDATSSEKEEALLKASKVIGDLQFKTGAAGEHAAFNKINRLDLSGLGNAVSGGEEAIREYLNQALEGVDIMNWDAGGIDEEEVTIANAMFSKIAEQLKKKADAMQKDPLMVANIKVVKEMERMHRLAVQKNALAKDSIAHSIKMANMDSAEIVSRSKVLKGLDLLAASYMNEVEHKEKDFQAENDARKAGLDARLKFADQQDKINNLNLRTDKLPSALRTDPVASPDEVVAKTKTFDTRLENATKELTIAGGIHKFNKQLMPENELEIDDTRDVKKHLLAMNDVSDKTDFQKRLSQVHMSLLKEQDERVKIATLLAMDEANIVDLTEEEVFKMAKNQEAMERGFREAAKTLESAKEKSKNEKRAAEISGKTVKGAQFLLEDLLTYSQSSNGWQAMIIEGMKGEALHQNILNKSKATQVKLEAQSIHFKQKILENLRKEARESASSELSTLTTGRVKNMALGAFTGRSPKIRGDEPGDEKLREVQQNLLASLVYKNESEIQNAILASDEATIKRKYFAMQGKMLKLATAKADADMENLRFATHEMAQRHIIDNQLGNLKNTVGMNLQQEILQAISAKNNTEMRRKMLDSGNSRYLLSMMAHDTEMESLKDSVRTTKDQLAMSVIKGDIKKTADLQLEQSLAELQKGSLIAGQNELILSAKTEMAEKMKRANELQEMSNNMAEMRQAKDQAFMDQGTLEVGARASNITEKMGAFGAMRRAGTKASMTGNSDDLASAAQAQLNYNKILNGTTGALDQVNVEMANMAVSASNFKSDLVSIAFDSAKSGLKEVFSDIATGSESIGEAFAEMGNNLGKALSDRLMEHNIDQIMNNLAFAFTGKKPEDEAEKMRNAMKNAHDYHVAELKKQADASSREMGEIISKKIGEVELDINTDIPDLKTLEAQLAAFPGRVAKFFESGGADFLRDLKGVLTGNGFDLLSSALGSNTDMLEEVKVAADLLREQFKKTFDEALATTLENANKKDDKKKEEETKRTIQAQAIQDGRTAADTGFASPEAKKRTEAREAASALAATQPRNNISAIEAGIQQARQGAIKNLKHTSEGESSSAMKLAMDGTLIPKNKHGHNKVDFTKLEKRLNVLREFGGGELFNNSDAEDVRFQNMADGRISGGYITSKDDSIGDYINANRVRHEGDRARGFNKDDKLYKHVEEFNKIQDLLIKAKADEKTGSASAAISLKALQDAAERLGIKLDSLKMPPPGGFVPPPKPVEFDPVSPQRPHMDSGSNDGSYEASLEFGSGGKVQKYHDGGFVRGYQKGGEVPAMLQEGEFVVPRKYTEGGKARLGERAYAGATGLAQQGASVYGSYLIDKWMGGDEDKKDNKPTFDEKRWNTLGLDSDVNMKGNDSRLSARFRAQSNVHQDYKGYLKDMSDYKTAKVNEKFQKRMGYLNTGLGIFSSAVAAKATQGLALGAQAAWQGTRNTVQGRMGFGKKENVETYRQLKAKKKNVNYSEVARVNKMKNADDFEGFLREDAWGRKTRVRDPEIGDYAERKKGSGSWKSFLSPKAAFRMEGKDSSSFWRSAFGQKQKKNGKNLNAGGSVPAMLTKGETVISQNSAKRIGYDNLNRMNTTGEFPIVDGIGGIDNVGPVSLNSGDFVLRKSSTDKLNRTNPNMMRFASQNPDGFRRASRGYYNGGVVDSELTFPSASMEAGGSYGTRQAPGLSPQPESSDPGSASSSSGGAVTNNINVNVTIDESGGEASTESSDTQGSSASYSKEKDLSQKIKAAVLDVIRQEKRVGGELS